MNFQCIFFTKCCCNKSCFVKRTVAIDLAVVFDFQNTDLEVITRKKLYVYLFFSPFCILCSSKFSSRNLKDANFFIFLWCNTTSNILFVPGMIWLSASCQHNYMICMYGKYLLFTIISYVHKHFLLNSWNRS